jgi:Domain of unknown function (DUF4386)
VLANRSIEISPRVYARVGGVLYLIIIVAGATGELVLRGASVVSGNAAATAHNIMASASLWRAGIAGDLVMHLCDVPLMMIFYVLLRPVNSNLALLAVLFNLTQTAVLVANKLNLLLPIFLLGDAEYLKAFTPEQLQALSYVSLRTHDNGFAVGLIFFGGHLPRARLPDHSIRLLAANARRADADRRSVLHHKQLRTARVAVTRRETVSFHSAAAVRGGTLDGVVASCERR